MILAVRHRTRNKCNNMCMHGFTHMACIAQIGSSTTVPIAARTSDNLPVVLPDHVWTGSVPSGRCMLQATRQASGTGPTIAPVEAAAEVSVPPLYGDTQIMAGASQPAQPNQSGGWNEVCLPQRLPHRNLKQSIPLCWPGEFDSDGAVQYCVLLHVPDYIALTCLDLSVMRARIHIDWSLI